MELAWAWSELGQAHHIHPRGPQSLLGSVPPAVGNHAPRWRREAEQVGKEKRTEKKKRLHFEDPVYPI